MSEERDDYRWPHKHLLALEDLSAEDIRFLLRRMPIRTERQTLLFSATLSHRVLELAYEHMNEPEKLVVETETVTAARVRQVIYYPADDEKLPLLLGLLSRSEGARIAPLQPSKADRVLRSLLGVGGQEPVLSFALHAGQNVAAFVLGVGERHPGLLGQRQRYDLLAGKLDDAIHLVHLRKRILSV